MTDLKPKIFIGSSTAGYSVAERVKTNLSSIADCFLWQEKDVWEPNRSTFDNLIRMSNYFDFGVFVATADDLTLTNDKLVIEARDNVILEMSLFLGAMGHNKSFLLVEEGVKLPSDFNGIFMPRFDKQKEDSIISACEAYKAKISEHYSLGHLSLYPTTALAIGYYKNFVADLVESVQTAEKLEFNGIEYTDFKLKVVIPSDLKGMIREKAAIFYKRNGFLANDMKAKFRKHHLWFQLDPKNAPTAIMYDMPSTLTGVDDAIELILQKSYKGRTKMQEVIEQKELNNFRRVLQLQIDSSPFAQLTVEIIDEF
ncbi:Predicted nucleotide-binding protein containing TIR-like domain-containing protein [Algoriphagus ornithinivorans]|uniref:CD-NTase-associated protein 12 n=1 Tax=Algoriphagus ornithinivorans TaxID=226506 RepID=A0A1I5K3W9_9BACT|nr:STING domain-containing protein [Algoriphagus ornithinivorans]SFO79700.1 Predicted nucleotide-binding protein containing TIR-like domain-containing protein [Algoriphagus ornithinivorans]